MRFVDEVEFVVASGKGGDGAVSFRREAKTPRGGPDGGDGGRGGSVVFRASRQRNTLVDFRWNRTYRAGDGQGGMTNQMYGRAGNDLLLEVPVGTIIHDAGTGEMIADLADDGSEWSIAGGKGGRGNMWFKTATRQTPTFAEDGAPGSELRLRLELKLIADIGLLGFPNAGKSTFISRISAAKPKVADYPFTTLVPHLGVVSVTVGESFVVADIPGLVEGAAEGRGLGHQFLKHVERCALYVHLVAPHQPHGDPVYCWNALNAELEAYAEALAERPQLVVLTKIDTLPPADRERWVTRLAEATGAPVFAISAVTGEGIKELVFAAWKAVLAQREAEAAGLVSLKPVARPPEPEAPEGDEALDDDTDDDDTDDDDTDDDDTGDEDDADLDEDELDDDDA
jgi:GTP-binding protein